MATRLELLSLVAPELSSAKVAWPLVGLLQRPMSVNLSSALEQDEAIAVEQGVQLQWPVEPRNERRGAVVSEHAAPQLLGNRVVAQLLVAPEEVVNRPLRQRGAVGAAGELADASLVASWCW